MMQAHSADVEKLSNSTHYDGCFPTMNESALSDSVLTDIRGEQLIVSIFVSSPTRRSALFDTSTQHLSL
jgi:hypothetical protein